MFPQAFFFSFAVLTGSIYSNGQITDQAALQNLLIDNNITNGTVLKFWGTIDRDPNPAYPLEYFVDNEGNYFIADDGRKYAKESTDVFTDPSEIGYSLIDYTYTVTADANKNLFVTQLSKFFAGFTGLIIELSDAQAEDVVLKGSAIKMGIY